MCLWITRAGWIARCDYGIPNCISRSLLRLLTSATFSPAPSIGGRRPRSRRAVHDVRHHASHASECDTSDYSEIPPLSIFHSQRRLLILFLLSITGLRPCSLDIPPIALADAAHRGYHLPLKRRLGKLSNRQCNAPNATHQSPRSTSSL